MKMSFGKYKNKPVAYVFLKDPQYFKWMRSKDMDDKKEYTFAMKLLRIFDEKPILKANCVNVNCSNKVTRFTLYKGIFTGLFLYCDICDVYISGAMPGTLTVFKKIEDVFFHNDINNIIKSFREIKQVPKKLTEKELVNYFNL